MSTSSSALPNFSPPAFKSGLADWSSGDGSAGSDSYAEVAEAAYVPSDSDFSGCLELIKTHSVQKLRAFAKTPMRPETYLRIRTRIKSVTGNLPAVRIAGWAGNDSDKWVPPKSGRLWRSARPERWLKFPPLSGQGCVMGSIWCGALSRHTGISVWI
ncbi:MAG: hypothetical protein HOM03_03120 [Marinovum sp.]|nr:hypothetical protein [Marinovum sp.]